MVVVVMETEEAKIVRDGREREKRIGRKAGRELGEPSPVTPPRLGVVHLSFTSPVVSSRRRSCQASCSFLSLLSCPFRSHLIVLLECFSSNN